MNILEGLQSRAAAHPAHIVLSEGQDIRIATAAIKAVAAGFGRLTLLGQKTKIAKLIDDAGGALSKKLQTINPVNHPLGNEVITAFFELRKHKGITLDQAKTLTHDPLIFAAMLVRLGYADGTLGGAVSTTSDTVRAALQVIGKAPEAKLVSSCFLMILPDNHQSGRHAMIFSDCGLVIDPSAPEIASIAAQSALSCKALIAETPKIALLSFSTKGSATHHNVDKVSKAAEILLDQYPNLSSDGELQFDAAFSPDISASKAKGSNVAGHANVMIFPNLDAGNIGYKIAQRVGGCKAIGPIIQGLAQPANDLSRGCTTDDVLNMIAVTVLQFAAQKGTI